MKIFISINSLRRIRHGPTDEIVGGNKIKKTIEVYFINYLTKLVISLTRHPPSTFTYAGFGNMAILINKTVKPSPLPNVSKCSVKTTVK